MPQLLVWCSKTEEMQNFFDKFRLDGPNLISTKVLAENEFIVYQKHDHGASGFAFPPGSSDHKQAFVAKAAN